MKIGAEMHVCFARLRVKIHVTRPIVHDVIERQRDNPDTHMEAANLILFFCFFVFTSPRILRRLHKGGGANVRREFRQADRYIDRHIETDLKKRKGY